MSAFTVRDYLRVKHLSEAPRGLPVRNAYVRDFVGYEIAGLVTLSPCLRGDGDVVDPDFFWAEATEEFREAVAFAEAIKGRADVLRDAWGRYASQVFGRG